jgi:hypothetical protein
MSDLGYLQEQISSTSTINHALELHVQISLLKEEKDELEKENQRLSANDKDLIAQNQGQLECIKMLEKKLEDVKRMTEEREKKFRGEIKRQEVSMDSLFEDLSSSRAENDRLHAQLDSRNDSEDQREQGSLAPEDIFENRPVRQISRIRSQADLLQTVCDKKQATSGGFFSIRASSEKKGRELEQENTKLKSTLVRVQAQYKEEVYANKKIIEGLLKECQLKNGASGVANVKASRHNPNARTISEDDDRPSLPSSSNVRPPISGGGRPNLPSRPSHPTRSASLRRIQEHSRPSLPPRSASLRRIQDYKNRKQEKHESLLDDASHNTSPTSASFVSRVSSISSGEPIRSPLLRSTSLRLPSWRLQGLHQEPLSKESGFLSPTKTSQSLRPPASSKPNSFSPARELRQENEAILLQHTAYKDGSNKVFGAAHNFMNMEQPTRSSSLRLLMTGH